jgi:hypothetical protein
MLMLKPKSTAAIATGAYKIVGRFDGGLPPDRVASLPIGMVVNASPTSPPAVRFRVLCVSGTAE